MRTPCKEKLYFENKGEMTFLKKQQLEQGCNNNKILTSIGVIHK